MRARTLTAALAACLFLVITTTKWATFDRFGSAMPDWDQWDAEGIKLFIPWHAGDHFLAQLFHPHNEHRVILTKLQNLTLGLLNGQWDARLEAVANAMLHAAIAAGLWVMGRRWLAGPAQALLFVVLFALFGLPVAWQNVLGGFHSQQYWLVGLSFAAIVTLPFFAPWTLRWWLGALAAILVLGSMGSGLLAAAAVLIVVGWRWWRREIAPAGAWPTIILAVALVAVGLLTRVEVDWHQEMKAKTIHDFVFTILHSLQWPWRDQYWAAVVLWLPWLLAALRVLLSPPASLSPSASPGDAPAVPRPAPPLPSHTRLAAGPAIVALGGWVLLQLAATGYARGAGADYPAPRYMDTLSFGMAVNALALGWLLTATPLRRAGRQALLVLGLAWMATLGTGLYWLLEGVLRVDFPEARRYYRAAEANVRRYLATNDPRHLASPDIPYPSPQGIIDPLADPRLRAMIAVPLRPPLVLTPAPPAQSAFVANDARSATPAGPTRQGLLPATPPLDYTPTWGSYASGTSGGTAQGEWRSQPVAPSRRGTWLKFETAGDLGSAGLSLELRAAADGSLLDTVRPSRIPGNAWRSAYVPAPRVPYVVVASDRDPARWFAFSGPAEMGPLSYWAWQATKHGLLLLYTSVGLTAALGVVALAVSRRSARPAPSADPRLVSPTPTTAPATEKPLKS